MRQQTTVACACVMAVLAGIGTPTAQERSRFVVGAGLENVFYGGLNPTAPPGLLTPLGSSSSNHSNGWAFTAERTVWRWLTVGVDWDNGSRAKLARRFALSTDPGVTFDINNAFFHARVFNLHASPTFSLAERLQVFGVVGAAQWDATSGHTFVAQVDGREEVRVPFSQKNNGWTGIYGGGVTFWVKDWIGARARYQFIRMKQGADAERDPINVRMHKFAWMAVFMIP